MDYYTEESVIFEALGFKKGYVPDESELISAIKTARPSDFIKIDAMSPKLDTRFVAAVVSSNGKSKKDIFSMSFIGENKKTAAMMLAETLYLKKYI